jgi:hypothetical protein
VNSYSLSHLSDSVLIHNLAALVARDRATTAELLAHIAEVDARRLYLPAASPSMYAYCVHELRLSEDAAYKRIQAARAGRQFPAIFAALADGRLHLAGACLLAPHLTAGNADALLEAAAHKTKAEVEALVAARFPRPETLGLVEALPTSPEVAGERWAPEALTHGLAPGQVVPHAPGQVGGCSDELAPGQVAPYAARPVGGCTDELAPGQVAVVPARSSLAPMARARFLLELTIGQCTHDKLRYARELLGHQIPSGDLAQVLDHALDALIGQLESRKFAATGKPRRRPQRTTTNPRHIPAHVRRAVWERDGGQCSFVSETGRRCPARTRLEFDHVVEVARGGQATVEGIRLRCRAHNQYGAERTFGIEFMRTKREQARQRAAEVRCKAEAQQAAQEAARKAVGEVIPALRALGFSAEESRRAAALCEVIPQASLEDRVKRALSYLCPRSRPHGRAMPSLASVP